MKTDIQNLFGNHLVSCSSSWPASTGGNGTGSRCCQWAGLVTEMVMVIYNCIHFSEKKKVKATLESFKLCSEILNSTFIKSKSKTSNQTSFQAPFPCFQKNRKLVAMQAEGQSLSCKCNTKLTYYTKINLMASFGIFTLILYSSLEHLIS